MKRVLTINEACEYLGYKKSYLYRLTSAGILPHSKPTGRKLYFDREKLEEWMLSNPSLENKEALAESYLNAISQKRAVDVP